MIKKNKLLPEECSLVGSYECQIPMPINGRVRYIDYCIADIVAALNAANIKTEASCCGHGKMSGSIILEDGRELIIKNVREGMESKEELDEFHYHEMIDRLYFISTMISEMIEGHLLYEKDKELKNRIDKINSELIDAYNYVSSKRMEKFQ